MRNWREGEWTLYTKNTRGSFTPHYGVFRAVRHAQCLMTLRYIKHADFVRKLLFFIFCYFFAPEVLSTRPLHAFKNNNNIYLISAYILMLERRMLGEKAFFKFAFIIIFIFSFYFSFFFFFLNTSGYFNYFYMHKYNKRLLIHYNFIVYIEAWKLIYFKRAYCLPTFFPYVRIEQ